MLQASMLDGLSFDPFSFQEDGFATSEVDVGGCEIFEALVVAPVVVQPSDRTPTVPLSLTSELWLILGTLGRGGPFAFAR